MYTPQMIVNGREQFVGSSASDADRAIARAVAKPSFMGVFLSARRGTDAHELTLDWRVAGAPGDAVLELVTEPLERRTTGHAATRLAGEPVELVVGWVEAASSLAVLGAGSAVVE